MRIRKGEQIKSDIPLAINLPVELQNPELLEKNRLDARSALIPAKEAGVYYYNRYNSDRIMSLNGDYRFILESEEAPEGFEAPDYDDSDWDIIDVPSMWQYRGYSDVTYPNVEYPFPPNPPYILRLNPVGCYRRAFEVTKEQLLDRAVLHFAGVDNAFYVYINGRFAGFAKGCRIDTEFDVTELLKEGANTIAVKVYTYSDASYLENQDMLLASGIFRDVYLIFTNKCALWDYEIITDMEKMLVRAYLWEEMSEARLKLTFDGEAVEPVFDGKCAEYTFLRGNRELWTAETPNLYDLTFELYRNSELMEVHSKRVGFVTSEVKGRLFLVNGKPVRMKGTNRHDNNCDNGRALTTEQIREDLLLMKEYNINAIRCSHYPNSPELYEFASELGIYVMDEADLESHGCGVMGDQGMINKMPQWKSAFLDRTMRMQKRDKNETCVVIWSIGNEIGAGQNAEDCAAYLRKLEDKKPVQYRATNLTDSDFIICGYPNIYKMSTYLENNREHNLPLLMIEYAHAMGNSPGNLEHIWDFVMEHPEFMGGYVWEFRSHGKRRISADGVSDYLYGGDFNDDNHWSNFTLDGFLTSDGTPKPSMEELKYAYAPVRLAYDNGVLKIYNVNDFVAISKGDIEISWEVSGDGKVLNNGVLDYPEIAARECYEVKLTPEYEGCDCFLTVYAKKNGRVTYLKQFELPATCEKAPIVAESFDAVCDVNTDKVTVKGAGFTLKLENGVPVHYEKAGKVYFDTPMRFVTYRAETDNDGIVGLYPRWIEAWEKRRLHKMNFYTISTDVERSDREVLVKVKGLLTADHCYAGFKVDVQYKIIYDGMFTVDMTVKPFGKMPELGGHNPVNSPETKISRLPRFGVCFKLDKGFETAKWFGRGPGQNYPDAVSAAPVGVYEMPLNELNFAFDMPQETGTRTDVRQLQVKSGECSFNVYGNDSFSFSVHPWSLQNLRAARHPSELKEDDAYYLYIDYRMRGLGSMSCGPEPEEEYDFIPHDFRFVFGLNGESGDEAKYFMKELGEKTQKITERYVRPDVAEEREELECRQF
ncbi:MAG: hypothetical protein J6B39_01890 [Lachnospiraceae bacterium]|nr:hypothetical protein [Lachnospiraceae bacterium]